METRVTLTSVLAALPLAACLAAPASAQQRPTRPTPIKVGKPAQTPVDATGVPLAPLSPADARAQAGPELMNVPAIPLPRVAGQQDEGRDPIETLAAMPEAVEFDLKTRVATVFQRSPLEEAQRLWFYQRYPQMLMQDAGYSGFIGVSPGTAPEPAARPRQSAPAGAQGWQHVLGGDQRVRITPTTSYPARTACKLYMTFPNGKRFVGSGAIVGNKYVITAGHCVHSKGDGGWATSIRVVPAQDNTYKPYGDFWAVRLRSWTGWTNDENYDHDMALITLDRAAGNSTGWLGLAYFSNIDRYGYSYGYPGEKSPGPGLGMWFTSGQLERAGTWPFYNDDQIAINNMDVTGGQSGSGVYALSNSNRYVTGVVSHEWTVLWSKGNRATRVTSGKFNTIIGWINSGN